MRHRPEAGNRYSPRAHHGEAWREVEDRRLGEWAAAGLTAREMGVRLGRTTFAVRMALRRLGIRLRTTDRVRHRASPPDRAA